MNIKLQLTLLTLAGVAFGADVEPGFQSLFNGRDLTGWEGNLKLWSVQDGVITGITGGEPETKLNHNTFLVNTNITLENFELRLSYRIVAGNSGIQYRSKVRSQGEFGPIVNGYQADFEANKVYSGILYEEGGRGILAQRGQKTVIKADATDPKKHKVDVTGSVGKSEEIQAKIKHEDWNDYVVIARGKHLQHFINGAQTVDVVDEHEAKAAKSGILALQIHVGPPMTVQFRNIRVQQSKGGAQKSDLDLLQGTWVPTELIANGTPVTEDNLSAIKVTMKGSGYTVERPNGEDRGTFKLSGTGAAKWMDLSSDAGREIPAIYEVTADTFKACYALRGGSRPTEFKSEEGSEQIYIVYKRKTD